VAFDTVAVLTALAALATPAHGKADAAAAPTTALFRKSRLRSPSPSHSGQDWDFMLPEYSFDGRLASLDFGEISLVSGAKLSIVPCVMRTCLFALVAGCIALAVPGARSANAPANVPSTNRYDYRANHSRDGIGKFYFNREIAHVMGHQAADWLERPERDAEEHTDTLVAHLSIQPGEVIADIGAGTGYFTRRLARKTGPKGLVLAVDIQPEMLALLETNMAQAGITNARPVLGTITDPKLPPASVDLALMVDVYHEFDHPFEMMQAIATALKPGGRVVFVEFRGEDPAVPIKALHKMTEAQVKLEMSGLPLHWGETLGVLPRQHIITFYKDLERVVVATNAAGFMLTPSGRPFQPLGFNYDHDEQGRLLEDYWETQWSKVEEDLGEMRRLGANVVRIHLQFARFMLDETTADPRALQRYRRLLQTAEHHGLRLDVTGLGCYQKTDVPAWYDALDESRRWAAQAAFWTAVARAGRESGAIFCYDLMNEPVAPSGAGQGKDWLGPPFAGKYFVQWISRENNGRPRPEIARAWLRQLARAIRHEDPSRLLTVGLVDWSLPRPGLDSGFHPRVISPELDFISVHLYPERGKVAQAIETLGLFSVGKPLLLEETFPLRCSMPEFNDFMARSRETVSGWLGFYWGKTPEECKRSKEIADLLMLQWLEWFQKQQPSMTSPPSAPER
jgi:SAM-dependent methyltransferase